MRIFLVAAIAFTFHVANAAAADNGMVTIKSAHGVKETVDRMESALKEKGVTVVARVDHAEAAAKNGLALRPTTVLIFGNPKAGTPMMQCAQTMAIDLPQKALVWEDDKGEVWLAYNDQLYLARRHGATSCDQALAANAGALAGFAKVATER
ncbi:MAG: DUF302 domain-containing protein [Casimicrobiaceae bacterium]